MVDRGPAEVQTCLVYRRSCSDVPRLPDIEGLQFYLLDTPARGARLWLPLMHDHGARALPRVIAKLIAPFRMMYCLVEDGAIVHHGWMVVGRSPLYHVGPADVVIGPISTREDRRGRGFAPFGLGKAMRAMQARGHPAFFIHTYDHNAASQRAIAKCGFGAPIAAVPRLTQRRPSSFAR